MSREDQILILQIAFALVGDSFEFADMPLNERVEEVSNTYKKMIMLLDGKEDGKVVN